jgi:hypothetical protein
MERQAFSQFPRVLSTALRETLPSEQAFSTSAVERIEAQAPDHRDRTMDDPIG